MVVMKTYPVSFSLMQEIVNILQALPYGQVANTMAKVQQLVTAIDNEPPPPAKGNGGDEIHMPTE
jgi:hypothetical protein